MISGTVASPCLTPPLAVLLGFVAKQANPLLGFLTLWFFAMGMGVLLIIIGTFSTTASFLPASGGWMIEIKKIFGFVLLIMCVYFLQSFVSQVILFRLYAILVFIASLYYLITSRKSLPKIIFAFLLATLAGFLLLKGRREKEHIVVHNKSFVRLLACRSFYS